MINIDQMEIVQVEIERYLAAANAATSRLNTDHADRLKQFPNTKISGTGSVSFGSSETGALRRASLDLTRALAVLRERQ